MVRCVHLAEKCLECPLDTTLWAFSSASEGTLGIALKVTLRIGERPMCKSQVCFASVFWNQRSRRRGQRHHRRRNVDAASTCGQTLHSGRRKHAVHPKDPDCGGLLRSKSTVRLATKSKR